MAIAASDRIICRNFDGVAVELTLAASKLAVVELPAGTTHVRVRPEAGSAAYFIHLWPASVLYGTDTDEANAGVPVAAETWLELPVARLDRPSVGLSVTSANKTAHGGDPVVVVVPTIDPLTRS